MSKSDIIDRFLNFAPVTREELSKAMEAASQEEDEFWKEQAAKESAQKNSDKK